MSFEAHTERVGTAAVVSFLGELDIASEAPAREAFASALMDDGDVLVADLRGLTFVDSSGVRVLLVAHLNATKKGMRFGVARGDGMVRRLLEVTRIHERFPVVDDPAELTGQ